MNLHEKQLAKLIFEGDDEDDFDAPENVDVDGVDETRLSPDSLDDQIDSFLIKFESDSVKTSEESLMESLTFHNLKTFLIEQEGEEEEPEEKAEDKPEEPEVPEPAGSEDREVDLPAEDIKMLPINLDEFTKRVIRLSKNAEYLLDIRNVIINRTLNYILDNYDLDHRDTMIEILDREFGLEIEEPEEIPSAPPAVGAWAGGTGGLGGGGA